ncbi:MAG: hypothetical protein OER88_05385, partial [Planctomycetota bacterium]|nr:hypothetical protein [Planctomycetota bacterium]
MEGTQTALLEQARTRGASDLYLAAGKEPFCRVEGEIVPLPGGVLAASDVEAFARGCAALAGAAVGTDIDFCFDREGLGRFRANLHHHVDGWGLSLKCVPQTIPTLEELELPETLHEVTW